MSGYEPELHVAGTWDEDQAELRQLRGDNARLRSLLRQTLRILMADPWVGPSMAEAFLLAAEDSFQPTLRSFGSRT